MHVDGYELVRGLSIPFERRGGPWDSSSMAVKHLRKWWQFALDLTKPNLVDYRHELMLFDFTKERTLENWDCLSDTDVDGRSIATFKPNGKGIRQIMYA